MSCPWGSVSMENRASCSTVEGALQRIGPAKAAAVVSGLIVIHYLYLISSSHELLVSFVPDDGFYELQIARHHALTGVWSFDNGFTTTTGFHLLNVYLMSWFPVVFQDPRFGAKFWMGVGLGTSIAAAFVLTRFVYDRFGPFSIVTIAVLLTAPTFTVLSGGLLEYPYVILFGSTLCCRGFQIPAEAMASNCHNILSWSAGKPCGSDFGGLPLPTFLACLIELLSSGRRHRLSKSAWGLAGATVGLAVVFFHNYLLAGHFLSGSSMAKALWGVRDGYSLVLPAFIAFATLTTSARILAILVGLLLIVTAMRLQGRTGPNSPIGEQASLTNRCWPALALSLSLYIWLPMEPIQLRKSGTQPTS